jgi:hypothetical protein
MHITHHTIASRSVSITCGSAHGDDGCLLVPPALADHLPEILAVLKERGDVLEDCGPDTQDPAYGFAWRGFKHRARRHYVVSFTGGVL